MFPTFPHAVRILAAALLLSVCLGACHKREAESTGATPVNESKVSAPTARTDESLRLDPPRIVAASVTSIDASGQGALLSATFEKDARLKDSIAMTIGDTPVVLARAKDKRQTYTGRIPFDWSAMGKELARAGALANEPLPKFRSRQQVSFDRTKASSFDVALFDRARVANVPFDLPLDTVGVGWQLIDPPRELLITALSVVEDPARTVDPCTGAGTPGGAWTFARLMTDIANEQVTGVPPAQFVQRWLETWLSDHTLNTFRVTKRDAMKTRILDRWPRLPDGSLDLDRAPFRLLAIVNRIDLRTSNAYGGGDAGEGRFVFGLVQRDEKGACIATPPDAPFTVILEYGIPLRGCEAIHDYAARWMALGDIALGDAAFNPALQAITDVFAARNAGGTRPNASAINQVRTNENHLLIKWELREFRLDPSSHQLAIVMPVDQPHEMLRGKAVIDEIITGNASALVNGTFKFPDAFPGTTPFRGGLALNQQRAWRGEVNDAAFTNARHQFSLATCDACHGKETHENSFLHIRNRPAGEPATLSAFLVGDGTLQSPTTHDFADPFVTDVSRTMGDLHRRRADLASLGGTCRASGIVAELQFRPLLMSH